MESGLFVSNVFSFCVMVYVTVGILNPELSTESVRCLLPFPFKHKSCIQMYMIRSYNVVEMKKDKLVKILGRDALVLQVSDNASMS
jgi:hypothetical protein